MRLYLRLLKTAVVITILMSTTFKSGPLYADSQKPEQDKKIVGLGVVTLYHPLVMYRRFQPFVDYLTSKTPFRFELKISQDYDNILLFLRNGTVDAALLGGLTYIKAKEETNITPIAAALGNDGKPFCRGVFITRTTNSDIYSVGDIKGKRFAFASKYSTSGSLAPFFHLYKSEGISSTDLGSYVHLKYHDSVAREILRGNYDAGVVLDVVAQKFRGKGMRFIGETDPFPGFVMAVTETADPLVINSLKNALLNLSIDNPSDRYIMSGWDDKIRHGFKSVSDSDYNQIRQMIKFLSGKDIMEGVLR